MTRITSWGRLNAAPHTITAINEPSKIHEAIYNTGDPGLAFGMGRSYGDSCLNPEGRLWLSRGLNHLIDFNEETGVLTCEAGVLLRDIQQLFIPRGWILPVTPGTQLVTVGGAIANDVHGKNHHAYGSFGNHVQSLLLARTDGELISCSLAKESDWFSATIGGLGLTGVIVQAEIQLHRVKGPWLATETIPYGNLTEFLDLSNDSNAGWEHSVSWLDCFSCKDPRGLFMRGNFIKSEQKEPKPKTLTMPLSPPFSLVNKLTLPLFNAAYYHLNKRRRQASHTHYTTFFYPLDNILEWNRMYGKKGFYQYQCVIPFSAGNHGIQAILKEIKASREGSFLTVLKTFGDIASRGMLSFPQPGITLAMDFPNHGKDTLNLLSRLDAIVQETRGRVYPAKDARMPRSFFEQGYPRLPEFIQYRDPGISSGLSKRLMEF